jgi:hypothetical protein
MLVPCPGDRRRGSRACAGPCPRRARSSAGLGVLATGEVRCTTCETTVIVFPHTLYGIVPSSQRAAFLAEAERTETSGKRFAVADETGAWTCPACSAQSIIAVVDFN